MLLKILSSLAIQTSTWTGINTEEDAEEKQRIVAWLPTIFQSDLQWFDDCLVGDILRADAQREEIMELAAKRIAERCGRSGEFEFSISLGKSLALVH